MNLADQVCSLELAKKLKDIGVNQESLFYYQNHPYNDGADDIVLMICERKGMNTGNSIINTEVEFDDTPKYSAFTVTELLNIIPNRIILEEGFPFNSFSFFMRKSFIVEEIKELSQLQALSYYITNYECDSTTCAGEDAWLRRTLVNGSKFADKKATDALAKTLVYLIENGLMK